MQEAKKIENAFSEAEQEADVIDITSQTSDTSLKCKYVSEKNKIESEFGTLEEIRFKLGLSKSKIAQLLLVKPATWSRWERNPSKAPPHIFQALKWYLLLADQNPDFRATAAPEFVFENHLKMIGSELKKIKTDSNFKSDLVNVFESKLSNVLTQGLTQIQVQVPVMNQAAPAAQIDESFKVEQYKIQSQVQNVEYLVRQMREEMAQLKVREPAPVYQQPMAQAPYKAPAPMTGEQVNTAAIALKIILGFLGVGFLGALTYLFVMYA